MKPLFAILGIVSLSIGPVHAAEPAAPAVAPSSAAWVPGPVPDAIRARFKLAPFYRKYLDARGLPVVGSARVSDAALAECAWIVQHMLAHRPEVLRTLGEANVRFAVMAYNEYTTDVPEHSDLKPAGYWNHRARGLGASRERPAVSGAEENLLCYPGDPYPTENISIHEFGHAIHLMAMNKLDPTFDGRLRAAYQKALAAGLWKETYAGSNPEEYWAEGTQSWFDNNRDKDAIHNGVNTRDKLKAYDPALAALCREVYGDLPWRYLKPAQRDAAGRAHLPDLPVPPPTFQWRPQDEKYARMAEPPPEEETGKSAAAPSSNRPGTR